MPHARLILKTRKLLLIHDKRCRRASGRVGAGMIDEFHDGKDLDLVRRRWRIGFRVIEDVTPTIPCADKAPAPRIFRWIFRRFTKQIRERRRVTHLEGGTGLSAKT